MKGSYLASRKHFFFVVAKNVVQQEVNSHFNSSSHKGNEQQFTNSCNWHIIENKVNPSASVIAQAPFHSFDFHRDRLRKLINF